MQEARFFNGMIMAIVVLQVILFRSRNSPYEEHARFTGAGNLTSKDLDVDGHTNLDNVSISGVSTISNHFFLQKMLHILILNKPMVLKQLYTVKNHRF